MTVKDDILEQKLSDYTHDVVIGGRFVKPAYAMFSGQSETQKPVYRRVEGKSGGLWLIPIGEKAAEGVHYWKESGGTSQGYGGATLSFKLVTGEVLKLQGPWSSNTRALFADTGIDIRDKHRTWGVIAKDRRFDSNIGRVVLEDVIYVDEGIQYGTFERIKEMAQKLSDERGEVLFYYSESRSGSAMGPVNWNKFGKKKETV